MSDNKIKIFRQESKFVAGVAKVDQFPKLTLPQIAFIGKSNVGKSTLINSICRRKSLAIVSNTPGRTRQINFFSVGGDILLVDLPGYGFAKVANSIKNKWEHLIITYLVNNKHLKLVSLLIDSRRGIKDNDIKMMKILNSYQIKFQIVLTKCDKIKTSDNLLFVENIKNKLASMGYLCNVISTDSKSGYGIKKLISSLLSD